MIRAFKKITVLSLISLVFGCTSSMAPAPKTLEQTGLNYLIGPGDTVNIFVWRNPEVTTSVTVRPDGKISTPLVEDLQASDKTPTQLARDIEGTLGEYIKSPIVTVIVSGFSGTFSQQISVVGEAAEPQALQFKENMTALDAMIAVGGLGEFADGDSAVIVRSDGDQQVEYAVKLAQLLREGDISANVPMQPGDILIIPEAWF
jgi:polysaccharide biosynthesis/export protein